MVLSNVGWAGACHASQSHSAIVVSPFRAEGVSCFSFHPQSLTAQRPLRGEPFGRVPCSCGRCNRSAYIPAAVPVCIFSSIPSPVKFTWNRQTLYRYLWGISTFPVRTNCPHRERQPPFYTTVGHIPVLGEFHEGLHFATCTQVHDSQLVNPCTHRTVSPIFLIIVKNL